MLPYNRPNRGNCIKKSTKTFIQPIHHKGCTHTERLHIALYMTRSWQETRLAQSVKSLVEEVGEKRSTRHPKRGACEREAIFRLTPVRETAALPSCLGSALHTGESEEKKKKGGGGGGGRLSIDITLKVTQSV